MHQSKLGLALLLAPLASIACSGSDASLESNESSQQAATSDTSQYGFEVGAQGWQSSNGAMSTAVSTAQAYAGTHSLAVTFNGTQSTVAAYVASPQIPAGTKVTFHVYCPSGTNVTAVQPYALQGADGGWAWTGAWTAITSMTANAWNTISYTLPTNAKSLAQIGVQFQTKSGSASTCAIDAVGWGSGTVVADAGAPPPTTTDAGSTPPPTTTDAGSTPPPPSTGSRWVNGYYVGYQESQYPPSAIDFSALTHITVGNVVPHSDGTLDLGMSSSNGPAMAKTVSGLAHAAGRKAILMLGGAGASGGFASAASSTYRAAFVSNIISAMNQLGYDGVDIDWEPLPTTSHADLTALAHALRAAKPGIILTTPVGWGTPVDSYYGTVASLFDQINVMSYSMADAWPGWQSWHSTALYGDGPAYPSSVDRFVKAYTASGVPAAKLGMGIGFYGSCWSSPVTAPRQATSGSSVVASDNTMSYVNIMGQYYTSAARKWDSTAQVPYLSFTSPTGPSRCTFVSYDDPQSILAKGSYAKQVGLGGTIIWTLAQGYMPNAAQKQPLLDAAKQGFLQ